MEGLKKIQEIYEKESGTYDLTRAVYEKDHYASRERALISEYVPKGSTVLVVGCGTGRHNMFLVDELKCRVVGIDLSPKMLKITRLKAKPDLILAAAEKLPFCDEVFDIVLCSRAFYLFMDKTLFLNCAYSCLKKRGRLLISTASEGPLIIKLLLTLRVALGLEPIEPLSYPYNARDLAYMLKKAGFDKIETRGVVLLLSGGGILRALPKFILNLLDLLESHLRDGKYVMAIGQKP